jgi:hypothetical protein
VTAPRQPHQPRADSSAEAAVRRAVVDGDAAAVVTICRERGSFSADADRLDPTAVDQYGITTVLHALALGMAKHPGLFHGVYGYAIALPEYDIAYMATIDKADTIAIGPNPQDDPRRRRDVMEALTALVDAGPRNRRVHTGRQHAGPGPTVT